MNANVISANYCKSQSGERQYYERQSCERQNLAKTLSLKASYVMYHDICRIKYYIYCAYCYTAVIMIIKAINSTL
jgi:hypothetical protein